MPWSSGLRGLTLLASKVIIPSRATLAFGTDAGNALGWTGTYIGAGIGTTGTGTCAGTATRAGISIGTGTGTGIGAGAGNRH